MSNPDLDTSNLDAMSHAKHYAAAMRKLVSRKLGLHPSNSSVTPIIDFGAGTGAYACRLSDETGSWIAAVEPTMAAGHLADRVVAYPTLEHLADRCALGAYSLNVFEHIEDDVQALRDLSQKVQPGRLLFILVPAHMYLWTPMDRAVGHQRRYSEDSLNALCAAAGLRIQSGGWFDRTGWLATLTVKAARHLGLGQKNWQGHLSPKSVKAFDTVFRLTEPLLQGLGLPFGKNRWVLVRKPLR